MCPYKNFNLAQIPHKRLTRHKAYPLHTRFRNGFQCQLLHNVHIDLHNGLVDNRPMLSPLNPKKDPSIPPCNRDQKRHRKDQKKTQYVVQYVTQLLANCKEHLTFLEGLGCMVE